VADWIDTVAKVLEPRASGGCMSIVNVTRGRRCLN